MQYFESFQKESYGLILWDTVIVAKLATFSALSDFWNSHGYFVVLSRLADKLHVEFVKRGCHISVKSLPWKHSLCGVFGFALLEVSPLNVNMVWEFSPFFHVLGWLAIFHFSRKYAVFCVFITTTFLQCKPFCLWILITSNSEIRK